MKTVKVHDAKTHLSRLLYEVEAGEEIIIARGDRPIVKMVPIVPGPNVRPAMDESIFGFLKGRLSEADLDEALRPLPDDIIDMMENGPIFPESKA